MVPFVARLHHTVPWTGISFLRIPSASQMLQKMQKMKSNDRWELWIHMKNKNKNYSRMFLFLPDLTLSVKEPCNEGNLLAILVEVDVSACSHARDRFKSISPSSWPHWKLQVNFEVQNFQYQVSFESIHLSYFSKHGRKQASRKVTILRLQPD